MGVGGGSTEGCSCWFFGQPNYAFLYFTYGVIRLVQRVTITVTGMNAADFRISKVGNPNKIVYFRIRKTSDDSILRQDSFNINTVSHLGIKSFPFAALDLSSEEVDIGFEIADTTGLSVSTINFGICAKYGGIASDAMMKRESDGVWIWAEGGGNLCYTWYYEEIAGIKKFKVPYTKLMKPKVKFRI